MLGTYAPGAEVEAFGLAINCEGNGVNVGHPAAVGVLLRMAYVMTKLRCFPT